jgi:hypothetical protein
MKGAVNKELDRKLKEGTVTVPIVGFRNPELYYSYVNLFV